MSRASVTTFGHRGTTSNIRTEISRELVNASDGAGLHFDGASSYISLANNAAADFGLSDFSIEFILNQTQASTDETYYFLAPYTGDNRMGLWYDKDNSTLKIFFRKTSNAHYPFDYDMANDFGTPTHYVVTADRNGLATLYKNGNSVASVDISASSDADIGNTNPTYISNNSTSTALIGSIYRFRTWNKLVDAKALYERADVDFDDQYGSQTNKISGAVDKNWGTNQADTGNDANDRATFLANYVWNIQGAITDISVASNVLQFTTSSSNQGVWYPNILTGGKKYRVTIRTGTITGDSFKVQQYDGSSLNDIGTLVASTTNVFEFTADLTTNGNLLIYGTGSGTLQINAASVDNEVVQIGCVSDYDLAFANPTQSRTVQDRSTNNVDGTASSSTAVTQVQPVVQLNTEQLSVGGTNAKIGIGLGADSSPQEMLHLKSANPVIRLEDSDPDGVYSEIDGAGGDLILSADGGADESGSFIKFKIDNSTKLTIDNSSNLFLGQTNNNTSKTNRLIFRQYATNDEGEGYVAMLNNATSGNNNLNIGGGSSSHNAATEIEFYTAADETIRTGTARLTIDSSGNVLIGSGTPASLVSGGDSPVLAIGGTDSGLVTGEKAGAISFITSDGSYTGTYSDGICGEITSIAETSTGAAYGLAFHTGTTTGSNRAERMRISSTGAVSLGPGTEAVTTLKPSLLVTDTSVGGSVTIRGKSPILAFDRTDSGTGTILTDGAGLNIKSGTLDSHGSTHLAISSTGLATFTRDAGSVIIADRTSSDGDVIGIKKDNAIRVRIGTEGITFPNGGTAPTAAANNQLAYYGEGTFTPTVRGSTTAGSYSISTAIGRYTRIGNVVTVNVSLINITEVTAGSGNLEVGGLPFQSIASSTQGFIGSTRFRSYTDAGSSPVAFVQGNSQAVKFVQYVSGGVDDNIDISGVISGSSDISFSITYFV